MSEYQKLEVKSKDRPIKDLFYKIANKVVTDVHICETDTGPSLLIATRKKDKKYWFCFNPRISFQFPSEKQYNNLVSANKSASKYKSMLKTWRESKIQKVSLTREEPTEDAIFHFMLKNNNEKMVYKVNLNRPAGDLIQKTSMAMYKDDVMAYAFNDIFSD